MKGIATMNAALPDSGTNRNTRAADQPPPACVVQEYRPPPEGVNYATFRNGGVCGRCGELGGDEPASPVAGSNVIGTFAGGLISPAAAAWRICRSARLSSARRRIDFIGGIRAALDS